MAGGRTVFTVDILIICIVAVMCSRVFGYNIIGISGGVTSMPMFFSISSWKFTALLSSLVALTVTRKFCRGLSRFSAAAIFGAGVLIDTNAVNVGILILGRILVAFGIEFAVNQSVSN